ncbi:hypothetical protein [Microbacterium stercoris]|uniref:Uncharacterized protein n=1 Tax=Microbacterium stercoris TaxID=2820289 RepID=A0A939TQB8_9MICO|nr:hypothetical protein [Microbacterium stercoris]MBO3662971.1 hypothetical protein [Microbacterium stercoris]
MTLGYDAADRHVRTTYDDGAVVPILRDAASRIVQRTIDPAGTAAAVATKHLYAGDADTPFATTTGAEMTRQVGLPGGAP